MVNVVERVKSTVYITVFEEKKNAWDAGIGYHPEKPKGSLF